MEFQARRKTQKTRAYERIRTLANQLTNSTKVTERRELGNRLRDDLAKYETRRQLAQEATPTSSARADEYSPAAKRAMALQQLWTTVLTAAVGTAQKNAKASKNKFYMDDIRLPSRILVICGKTDDEYEKDGIMIPRVSKKTARSMLKFFLEMLNNQNVLDEPNGEAEVLDMLDHLCSKPEYVGYFNFRRDFDGIFADIFERLGQEYVLDFPVEFAGAAKVLDTLLHTCNQIGMQMDVYVSEAIRVVANWCKTVLSDPDQRHDAGAEAGALPHLFSAVAHVLSAHPEHSIGPMKLCGGFIFRFCQKVYSHTKPTQKEALNRYLLAHLFVAQVAGKIQGFLDGDLGDLGGACLSERRLLSLLKQTIMDTHQMVLEADLTTGRNLQSENRAKRRGKKAVWTPLDSRQKKHLELVARLLACTQRLYISRVSWDAVEHPCEMLKAMLKVPGPDKYDSWVDPEMFECTIPAPDVLVKSPWVSLILKGIFSASPPSLDTLVESFDISEDRESENDPVLVHLAAMLKHEPRDEPISTYVAIIGACSEHFPGGNCWAVSSTDNWHRLAPVGMSTDEVFDFHASSLRDLARVVQALCTQLDANGGPDGDLNLQYWVLLVLTKLTIVTAVLVQMAVPDDPGARHLTLCWRRVWRTIFRPDLRYVTYTSHVSENSLGEMVFVLLTEMIRRNCLDSLGIATSHIGTRQMSFVHERQCDIWNLDIFTTTRSRQTAECRALFELILSNLHFVGLSETGNNDLIEFSDESCQSTLRTSSRRRLLVTLGLTSYSKALNLRSSQAAPRLPSEQLVGSIARCILGLVWGETFLWSQSWCSNDPRFMLTSHNLHPRYGRLVSGAIQDIRNGVDAILARLWSSDIDAENPHVTSLEDFYRGKLDPSLVVARRLLRKLATNEKNSMKDGSDFVAEKVGEQLSTVCYDFLKTPIKSSLDKHGDADEESPAISDGNIVTQNPAAGISFAARAGKEKLVLSLLVCAPKALTEDDFLGSIPDIVSFFGKAISQLAEAQVDPVEYFLISRELKNMAQALNEAHARFPSTTNLGKMNRSVENCESILRRYSERTTIGLAESTESTTPKVKASSQDDFWEDSEDDRVTDAHDRRSFDAYGSDRKRVPERRRSRKRRKTIVSALPPPNYLCARELAHLLIALDPTATNCRLCCEALLGTELNVDPDSINADMDLRLAEDCIQILSSPSAVLNTIARQQLLDVHDNISDSVLVMLCQMIDLIRASALPSSRLCMVGNYECARVVVGMFDSGLTVSEAEANYIVQLIDDETEWSVRKTRPQLRSRRVVAAMLVFKSGSKAFHSLFDKVYANAVVKAGLDDRCFLVRRVASIAAGIASSVLDERRIRDTVTNMTAPIGRAHDQEQIRDVFSNWYSSSGMHDEEHHNPSRQVDDALEVLESDSIFAKSVLASTTKNQSIFLSSLLEITEIAAFRPGLEFVCFSALKRIALARKYDGVAHMMDLEIDGLLAWWVRGAHDSNSDRLQHPFPLFLCGPYSFQLIMQYGQYSYICANIQSLRFDEESQTFCDSAVMNLVSRSRKLLVPLSLLSNYGTLSGVVDSDAMAKRLAMDPRLKWILANTQDSIEDGEHVAKLLKKHVVDIEAVCSILMHSDEANERAAGHAVQKIMFTVTSEDFARTKINRNLALFARRVLGFVGKSPSMAGFFPKSIHVYHSTLSAQANDFPGQQKKDIGDLFLLYGTSLTEQSILALSHLQRAGMTRRQSDAWGCFEVLGKFVLGHIKSGAGVQSQLGFFLHVLTEVALDNFSDVQPQLLGLLKAIIKESIDLPLEVLKREVNPAMKRLLAVCFQIHEQCQQNIILSYQRKLRDSRFELRRSCGFHLGSEGQSFSTDLTLGGDPPLCFAGNSQNGNFHERLLGSYNIIQWIVDYRTTFGLDSYTFATIAAPAETFQSHLDALGRFDSRYHAQCLTMDLMNDTEMGEAMLKRCLLDVRTRSLNERLWTSSEQQSKNTSPLALVNIDQRLLYSELLQLEKVLDLQTDFFTGRDAQFLMEDLYRVCKASCPMELKFAATRCMALFPPQSLVAMAQQIDPISKPDLALNEQGDMQKELQARCFECLAVCLKSSNASISVAAVGTLGVLLSTPSGKDSYGLADPASTVLLDPFANSKKKGRGFATSLSVEEVTSLKIKIGLKVLDDSNLLWCWDKILWSQPWKGTTSYEDWVCHVSASIILCCFEGAKEEEDGKVDKKIGFFWQCQRMALLDYSFASTVFPALILALVSEDANNESTKASPLLEIMTVSFTHLLANVKEDADRPAGSRKDSPRHKAILLVIDTLDLLRKQSQQAFVEAKTKARKATSKNGKLSALPPWPGVPYGVILHLDGLVVAQACMDVERFASALFFLELYLNALLSKSGGIFEELSTKMSIADVVGNHKSTWDISGFNIQIANHEGNDVLAATIKAMSMSRQCYMALHELEAADALENQLSSISFMDESTTRGTVLVEDNIIGRGGLETLQALSIQASTTQPTSLAVRVTESMDELGLQGLMTSYIDGVLSSNQSLLEASDVTVLRDQWFQKGMENFAWDKLLSKDAPSLSSMPTPPSPSRYSGGSPQTPGFFESVTEALNSYMQKDLNTTLEFIMRARTSVIKMVSQIGVERPSLSDTLTVVDKLRALKRVNDLASGVENAADNDSTELGLLDISWQMKQIVLAIAAAKNSSPLSSTTDALQTHLWQTCENAIQQQRPQMAETALIRLQYLLTLFPDKRLDSPLSFEMMRVRFEEAKIMECRGDFNSATQRTTHLIGFLARQRDLVPSLECLLADAQLMCGAWMTKYKTQQARVILREYLEPGTHIARRVLETNESPANTHRAVRSSFQLGNVLTRLYEDLLGRVQSKEWKDDEIRLREMESKLKTLEDAKKSLLSNRSISKEEKARRSREQDFYIDSLSSQVDDKVKERQNLKSLVPQYLEGALKSLLLAMKLAGTGDNEDFSSNVYRMVSLWFDCSEHVEMSVHASINAHMLEASEQISSFRFVCLTNQLFSRIEMNDDGAAGGFQKALQRLIFNMCNDHPYHCLLPLLSLENGNVDKATKNAPISALERIGKSKTDAANEIMNQLKKKGSPYVSQLVESYRLLGKAYNALAYAPTDKLDKQPRTNIKFSSIISSKELRLDDCVKSLQLTPCVVTSVPVLRPGKDYGNGTDDPDGAERIKSFEKTFDISPSGVSKPRIVICRGHKGGRYKQLVKGNDDVRQDAIMSQVFSYVNSLMDRQDDKAHRKRVIDRRQLELLRYEVVPLSPKSGVIEWVAGTEAFGNFVTGKKHAAYYPNEWTYKDCNDHYIQIERLGNRTSFEDRRRNFDEICSRFSPSYRFFFIENFGHSMESWHAAKMNYTRSVAVSSIVGHILGIGDRHLSNILVHKETGKVVHIDFGIVFEQGKHLRIPERVPFRLTREMVDGMGPCGTHGTFTDVAEATTRILRKHSGELVTILSAILADPLYGWRYGRNSLADAKTESGGPGQLRTNNKANETSQEEDNLEAVKTIIKIKEKLKGYEDSTSGEQQGVEGQVQLLINSARDPDNLCQIFNGWAPWV